MNPNNTDAQELVADVHRLLQELEPPAELAERVQHNPTSCPICYTDFAEDPDRARVYSLTICGHTFCKSCIDGFIDNRITRCPLCNITHGITRNGNSLLGITRNYLAEAILNQPNRLAKQKHFCWDCEVVYQLLEPAELYNQHKDHDTTFLGDLEDKVLKKFFWMLKRLKEKSYDSTRTQGMIQAFLVFLRNMMISLSQVEEIMQKDSKAFDKLKLSMRKLLSQADEIEVHPTDDKFMLCLAHLWSFEVEWARYNLGFIQTTRTPQGAAVTDQLLAKLREDWQSVLPIGLPDKMLPKFPGLSASARKLLHPKIEPEQPPTEESRKRLNLANRLSAINDKLADPKIMISLPQLRKIDDLVFLLEDVVSECEPRHHSPQSDLSWISHSSADVSALDDCQPSMLSKRISFLQLHSTMGDPEPSAKTKDKHSKRGVASKHEVNLSGSTMASSSIRKRSKN